MVIKLKLFLSRMSSKKKQKTLFDYLNSKDVKSWKVKPKAKNMLLSIRDMNQNIIKNDKGRKKR